MPGNSFRSSCHFEGFVNELCVSEKLWRFGYNLPPSKRVKLTGVR